MVNISNVPSLSIIDVGHGNSSILFDNEGIVVIDTGPGTALLEFIEEERIDHINYVLVSHADADHISGLIGLISSEIVTIGAVYLNTDSAKESEVWDDLLYTLDNAHIDKKLVFNTSLHTGLSKSISVGRVTIEILAPSMYLAARGPGSTDRSGRKLTSNSISAVIRLIDDNVPIALLPGDIDAVGLSNMLAANADVHARVAIYPHHGGNAGRGKGSNTFATDFTRAVQPQAMLFSIGRDKFQNPKPDVVAAIQKEIPLIHIACTQLSKFCNPNIPGNDGNQLIPLFAEGRESNICCAGTIHIDFSEEFKLHPMNPHQTFIDNHTLTPLCKAPTLQVQSSIEIFKD
ncbi:ComEC/Rec2 family competence protein [Hymenobacter volaticus]|uniref:MBL fold metallo-hydrolase n=1 Tax=Hymenobacter volaticus TaxID=2932254 RepID=A0ABY4GGC6_9BACT|nr:MBL fold metallo-hydrolase [Hymenobacter volaticus]UOQ69959.1 MBL fold metallo-hydrolase [Hymenobacter volaticus]